MFIVSYFILIYVFDVLLQGIPRTNNSLEAWHGVLGRTIGALHSSFFKFLQALHNEQNFQEIRIAKIESGHSPDEMPRVYREMNERLVNAIQSYNSKDDFDIIFYLNLVAFNFSL